MFRALLCPSSGARDYDVDYHIGRFVLGLLYVGGLVRLGWSGVQAAGYSRTRALACSLNIKNKITSGIQLVSYSSAITMMHGPKTNLINLDFIARTILGEQYRSLSSSLRSFVHSLVT